MHAKDLTKERYACVFTVQVRRNDSIRFLGCAFNFFNYIITCSFLIGAFSSYLCPRGFSSLEINVEPHNWFIGAFSSYLIAVEPPFSLKMNPRSMYWSQLLKEFPARRRSFLRVYFVNESVYFVNEIDQKN
jgi:hypothetical protein